MSDYLTAADRDQLVDRLNTAVAEAHSSGFSDPGIALVFRPAEVSKLANTLTVLPMGLLAQAEVETADLSAGETLSKYAGGNFEPQKPGDIFDDIRRGAAMNGVPSEVVEGFLGSLGAPTLPATAWKENRAHQRSPEKRDKARLALADELDSIMKGPANADFSQIVKLAASAILNVPRRVIEVDFDFSGPGAMEVPAAIGAMMTMGGQVPSTHTVTAVAFVHDPETGAAALDMQVVPNHLA